MDKIEKWQRLDQLALKDSAYTSYKSLYNESAVKFGMFIKWCPPKLRKMLYDYADSGRLMMQRMAGIALENMDFIEK